MNIQQSDGYLHVCPGESVQVNCSSTSSNLGWKLLVSDELTCEDAKFNTSSTVNLNITKCGFVLTDTLLSANTSSLTSTATLAHAGSDYNGSVLTCYNSSSGLTADKMANITIFVEGIINDF